MKKPFCLRAFCEKFLPPTAASAAAVDLVSGASDNVEEDDAGDDATTNQQQQQQPAFEIVNYVTFGVDPVTKSKKLMHLKDVTQISGGDPCFELRLCDNSGLVILDFDCQPKSDQQEFFGQFGETIESALIKSGFVYYVERSMNKGIHALVWCDFLPVKNISSSSSSSNNTAAASFLPAKRRQQPLEFTHGKLAVEFKKRAFTFPSHGYEQVYVLADEAPAPPKLSRGDLVDLFSQIVDPIFGPGINVAAELFSPKVDSSRLMMTTSAAAKRKLSLPDTDDGGVSKKILLETIPSVVSGADDVDCEEVSIDDEDDDDDDDGEDRNLLPPAPTFAGSATQQLLAWRRTHAGDGGDDEYATAAAGGPTRTSSLAALDAEYTEFNKILEGNRESASITMVPLSEVKIQRARKDCVARLGAHTVFATALDKLDEYTVPVEAKTGKILTHGESALFSLKSHLEHKLIQKLASSPHFDTTSHFQTLIGEVDKTISTLEAFLRTPENECMVYGENVSVFLDWINLSTKKVVAPNNVFETLSNPRIWFWWTVSYCRLVNFLAELDMTTGAQSRVAFDDFRVYRKITLLNRVGRSHDEIFEKDEYEKMRELTLEKYKAPFLSAGPLFFFFVLETLCAVEITPQVLAQFRFFVNLYVSRNQLNMQKEVLFRIKFSDLHFVITRLANDSEKGNVKHTSYICFERLPWISMNSDCFLHIVKKCFPNSQNIHELIALLADRMEYAGDELSVSLKNWKNCYPFHNGIFDFRTPPSQDQLASSSVASSKQQPAGGSSSVIGVSRSSRNSSGAGDAQYDDLARRAEKMAAGVERRPTSLFRNYSFHDGVVTPINHSFDFKDYLRDFERTNLLSLANFERYSREFCLYMRALFGTDPIEGVMGPFNYMNMIACLFNMVQGTLRDCVSQTASFLSGPGSDGKSKLLDFLKQTFSHDKVIEISAQTYFDNINPTNCQTNENQETMIHYDNEVFSIKHAPFKDRVCGGVVMSRGLFKNLDRKNNFCWAHYVLIMNRVLRFCNPVTKESVKCDAALTRRCFITQFYNRFGTVRQMQQPKEQAANGGQAANDAAAASTSHTILTLNNIKLDSERASNNIRAGLLYYFIDLINVFDIGNMRKDINDYLMSSMTNRRLIGTSNSKCIKSLLQEYVPLRDFCPEHEVARRQKLLEPVNFISFVEDAKLLGTSSSSSSSARDSATSYSGGPSAATTSSHSQSYADILDDLKIFGIVVNKHLAAHNNSAAAQSTTLAIANIEQWTLEGLKPVNNMTQRDLLVQENPHKNLNWDPTKPRSSFSSDFEFVTDSVPKDQRVMANHFMHTFFFRVLGCLVEEERVRVLALKQLQSEATSNTTNMTTDQHQQESALPKNRLFTIVDVIGESLDPACRVPYISRPELKEGYLNIQLTDIVNAINS
jgi:hypothetical protein